MYTSFTFLKIILTTFQKTKMNKPDVLFISLYTQVGDYEKDHFPYRSFLFSPKLMNCQRLCPMGHFTCVLIDKGVCHGY